MKGISPETTAMIMGGTVPALLLGVYSLLQKLSIKTGVSPGMLLIFIGCGSALVGIGFLLFGPAGSTRPGITAITLSLLSGLVWAVATGLILVAMGVYEAPIAKLAPLFNMNTLVAVLLGLIFLKEGQSVQTWKLLTGAVLIILGGTLVSTS